MLIKLRPRTHNAYRSLPVLGAIIDEFTDWAHRCGYTLESIQMQLGNVRRLAKLFQRRGRQDWRDLTPEDFPIARERFARRSGSMGATIGQVKRFLQEIHGLVLADPKPVAPLEGEVVRYCDYLRGVRGCALETIVSHESSVRAFLEFIRYKSPQSAIARLKLSQIEAFLQAKARTCNRTSLQHVVSRLRGFIRFHHAAGTLARPLHTMIDTVRVYRLEQLPKAWPWAQVQALLRSIDCGQPHGLRDYTLLFLMATYGLRRSEVVALTLDDVDWRAGVLRVSQRKTQQRLILPLTEEAGDCLQLYLRHGRPSTEHRELFLRFKAPSGPLTPSCVNVILKQWINHSGLELSAQGSHCLRHSLAMRLLRQGVALKAIGDTLGHRAVGSTAAYLRLGIDDLRDVCLSVPQATGASALLKPGWEGHVPRFRPLTAGEDPPTRFRSGLGAGIRRYLAIKRALGRIYVNEASTLLRWDAFLHRQQGRIQTVDRATFQAWASSLSGLSPVAQRICLRHTRNFLLFHGRDHVLRFIPEIATFPKASAPRPPRLVSVPEMARLLATASHLPASRANPLLAETVRIALILLFCCGLRRGELLRLRLTHFDPQQNLLRIEETKFHKSRLIPLAASVAEELRDYLKLNRQKGLPMEPGSFLIWNRNRLDSPPRRIASQLNHHWQHVCLAVGVVDERGRPPRIHDLRHSSAVAALERWYAQGQNVQSKLAHLSTYLGHVSPICTYHYLHMTPKLREAASQRFHQRFAPLFRKAGSL